MEVSVMEYTMIGAKKKKKKKKKKKNKRDEHDCVEE